MVNLDRLDHESLLLGPPEMLASFRPQPLSSHHSLFLLLLLLLLLLLPHSD